MTKQKRKKYLITLISLFLTFICILGAILYFLFAPANIDKQYWQSKFNEDYGITLHFDSVPENICLFYGKCSIEEARFNIHNKEFIQILHEQLGKYSSEAFEYIPKDFYIVGKIDDSFSKTTAGFYEITNDIIALNVNRNSGLLDIKNDFKKTVNHELFHSIDINSYLVSYRDFEEFDCSSISKYACTATEEFVAETWAELMSDNKTDTDAVKYLSTTVKPILINE